MLIVFTMSVFDLCVGECATIVKITATGAVASRLNSLGFAGGHIVVVLGFSLFHTSILVGVGATCVAIRSSVAKQIGVKLCK